MSCLIMILFFLYGISFAADSFLKSSVIPKNMRIMDTYQHVFSERVGEIEIAQANSVVSHHLTHIGYLITAPIPVYDDDTIYTSHSARVKINLQGGYQLNMGENTVLRILNSSLDHSNQTSTLHIKLKSGVLKVKLLPNNNAKRQHVQVKAGQAIIKSSGEEFIVYSKSAYQTNIIALRNKEVSIRNLAFPDNMRPMYYKNQMMSVKRYQLIFDHGVLSPQSINQLITQCIPHSDGKFVYLPKEKLNIIHAPDHAVKNRGYEYFEAGEMDNAIKEFESILKKEPGDPYTTVYLGLAYLNKKKFTETIDVWKRFKDKSKKHLDQEIQRQLTVLQIKVSHQIAKMAIHQESILKTDEKTIAVFDYHDLTTDKKFEKYRKAITMMIIKNLSKLTDYSVVERLQFQAIIDELKLSEKGIVNEELGPRAGRSIGANYLISGTLSPGSIQVMTFLTSTKEEKIISKIYDTVDEKEIYKLPMLLTKRILKIISADFIDSQIEKIIPHTQSYQAFINFSYGLEAMDAWDWKTSRKFFQRALDKDQNFTLARIKRDACPSSSTPDIQTIRNMSEKDISKRVKNKILHAIEKQRIEDGTLYDDNKDLKEFIEHRLIEENIEEHVEQIDDDKREDTLKKISNFPEPPVF